MEPGRTGFPPSRALRRGIELSDTPHGLAPDERGGDAGPSEARLTLTRSSRQSLLASPSSLGSPASKSVDIEPQPDSTGPTVRRKRRWSRAAILRNTNEFVNKICNYWISQSVQPDGRRNQSNQSSERLMAIGGIECPWR